MTDTNKRSYSLYINDRFLIELDMLVLNLRKEGFCRENGEKLRRVDLVYEALDLLKEKYQMSENPRYDSYVIRMTDDGE